MALGAVAVAVAGCGQADAVGENALVTAYVAEPLCKGAQRELAAQRGRAGELRVRAVCLPDPHGAERLDLTRIGANARRATEDSTSVAYLERLDPPANRFAEPILEAAELAGVYRGSGRAAMSELLAAIRTWDGGPLRASVRDAAARS
jgi:hypothetical protein